MRVEDAKGHVLWEGVPLRYDVLSREEAWLMVSMMKDVVSKGSAASVGASGFRIPAGGKTGTTNDYTDVWFIGYTADLLAGVWMGFDNPQKIQANAQGGRLAAPAWTSFMTEVYQRRPHPPDWPRPEAIITRQIDDSTGTPPQSVLSGGTRHERVLHRGHGAHEGVRRAHAHGHGLALRYAHRPAAQDPRLPSAGAMSP